MTWQPRARPFPPPALAALAGAALLAFATAGLAEPRATLGPEDTVRITVYQNADLTTETRISQRGTILFPLIGEVALAGHTPLEAAARIAEQLRRGDYIKNPQVNVDLVALRSRQVSVLGHVARPGRYPLEGVDTKLTDILAQAGGIRPDGADTVTVVGTRDGAEKRFAVDLRAMLRTGDLSDDFAVRSGDTVYVAPAPVFYIYGEVQRPGAYRLEPNLVVMQALSLGGGLTPRGTERGLRVSRRMPDGSVRSLEARPGDSVQPDDVIHVGESLF